jgi:hypothetical protein
MALEAPRPLLGARFYMKKLLAYLNNFQRKKLFCVQTLTKLPELTVFFLYPYYILKINEKGVGSGVGSESEAGSGSISHWYGSGDPDAHQNVMDLQHWSGPRDGCKIELDSKTHLYIGHQKQQ